MEGIRERFVSSLLLYSQCIGGCVKTGIRLISYKCNKVSFKYIEGNEENVIIYFLYTTTAKYWFHRVVGFISSYDAGWFRFMTPPPLKLRDI